MHCVYWYSENNRVLSRRLFTATSMLTYASPAWWGFTTAHDRQRMESVIRHGVRFGYCTTNQAPLAELVAEADETLFKNILHIKQHVLHQLLLDRTQSTYNLRSRKHDCSLTVKHSVTANEFLTRILYKDNIYQVISCITVLWPVRSVNGLFLQK